MKNTIRFGLALGLVIGVGACGTFADQSPENVAFRLTGETGTQVQAVYSTEFVAGITEDGITQVRIFGADTVLHTLPIDTLVNIEENLQFFVQIIPQAGDTADVAVQVEIDGREVLNSSGLIFPLSPWRYVYQFNQLLTNAVEVVI